MISVLAVPSFADLPGNPNKPSFESLFKEKSVKRIIEDHTVITNSEWDGDTGFKFISGLMANAPTKHAKNAISNYALYKEMSSTIKKFDYDPATKTIEMIAEAGGFGVHCWIKVTEKYWDTIEYEIIKGNLLGTKIEVMLWEKNNKTLLMKRGNVPDARKIFPSALQLIAVPLSEAVLGIASNNFRGYIEKEYKKLKNSK